MPLGFDEPRSAYVHVPFCARRCGYCNFTLLAGRDDLIEAYIQAISLEMRGLEQPRGIDTLFLGGGTPSHLSPTQLDRLLAEIARWLPLAAGGEYNVEANPNDVDDDQVEVLARHGVTRVSLGAQSFSPRKLALLEREHSAAQIACAMERLRAVGMSVSLDLIFGTPGETPAEWRADLQAALELRPDHVSTYGLTFERGTSFGTRLARGDLVALDEDVERELYGSAIDTLTAAGFEHYEVSNFARPGQRCRHNEGYWSGRTYLAFGPGAARFVDGRREINHRSTMTWLKRVLAGQSPVAEIDVLDPADRAREMLVIGLRRMRGVERTEFAELTGFSVDELTAEPITKFVELGLLADNGRSVRLTREGLYVSDALWGEILSASASGVRTASE